MAAHAAHRQDRTSPPPAEYCPPGPTGSAGFPTEVPSESCDIAIFENEVPSFTPGTEGPGDTGLERPTAEAAVVAPGRYIEAMIDSVGWIALFSLWAAVSAVGLLATVNEGHRESSAWGWMLSFTACSAAAAYCLTAVL